MRMFSVLVDKAVKFREPAIPDKRLTRVNPPAANRLEEGIMEVFTLACAAGDLEAAADLLALVEKWQARRPPVDEAAKRTASLWTRRMRGELERQHTMKGSSARGRRVDGHAG